MAPPAILVLLPAVMVPALLLAIPTTIWPAIVIYHAYCLTASFGAPVEPGFRPFRLASRSGRAVLLIGVVLLIAGEVAARYPDVLATVFPGDWRAVARRATPWWAFAVYSLAMNGYVEERFWRGALLTQTGIGRGALAFGLMHGAAVGAMAGLPAAVTAGVATCAAGLAWGWLRRRTGALWPCVLTHVAADAALLRIAASLLAQ